MTLQDIKDVLVNGIGVIQKQRSTSDAYHAIPFNVLIGTGDLRGLGFSDELTGEDFINLNHMLNTAGYASKTDFTTPAQPIIRLRADAITSPLDPSFTGLGLMKVVGGL